MDVDIQSVKATASTSDDSDIEVIAARVIANCQCKLNQRLVDGK